MNFYLKIVPPKWAFFYLVSSLALHYFWLKAGGGHWPFAGLGAVTIILGFAVMIPGWKLFHEKDTPVCPHDTPSRLIGEGPYRFTRNPMYLGMTLILSGIAFIAGTPPAFLAPLGFWLTVRLVYIPYEEKKMEALFGQAYLDYKRRVRRWC